MSRQSGIRAAVVLLTGFLAWGGAYAPAHADDASLRKDLTAVIALLGLPCGEVTQAVRQAENDHVASCRNGIRYRVFVNPAGRVIAQRQ